jgi:hypothetical protein
MHHTHRKHTPLTGFHTMFSNHGNFVKGVVCWRGAPETSLVNFARNKIKLKIKHGEHTSKTPEIATLCLRNQFLLL